MMNIKNNIQIMKNMGVRWTAFRLKYELQKKMGVLEKKYPPVELSDQKFLQCLSIPFHDINEMVGWWKRNNPVFFINSKDICRYKEAFIQIRGQKNLKTIEIADAICSGKYLYFSKWYQEYDQVNWHWNPASAKEFPRNIHWSKIPDLSKELGDIKYVWELSRFPFVYYLVRAYATTQDEKYVKSFWEHIESWIKANPPEMGANWKCGQEMSIRVMSWVFGLYAFYDSEHSTNERIFQLIKQIYMHGVHIDKHFDFALKSVKNNHSISEAAGMYTIGTLFPFFDNAGKLKVKGKKYLEREGLLQIYEDGSYLQHSMNYHRLVIQDYTWCLRLAQIHGDKFSDELIERLKKCIHFLIQMQDEITGRLPNYGMNDGALIHPLSSSDYSDYRPQILAMYYALYQKRIYSEGLHDESLIWLFGSQSLQSEQIECSRISGAYPIGGYYTIRSAESFAMIRCASYKDRPAQADMLHLDLWWKGNNVLCDAGTYSYNTDERWMKYFNGTSSHNTIMIDNKDQMVKASRFTWINWTQSRIIAFRSDPECSYFEGEHYGYAPIIHRRALIAFSGNWVVIDDIIGKIEKAHTLRQQWLLGTEIVEYIAESNLFVIHMRNGKYYMKPLELDHYNFEVKCGQTNPVAGWRSLYYGYKSETAQIVREMEFSTPIRFITYFSPYQPTGVIMLNNNQLRVNEVVITLNPLNENSINALIR